MAAAELLQQMASDILDGKFHEATDSFCQLVRKGHGMRELVLHAMTTAAPYLHVPSHEKLLPNGEFRNVNYDHTILGLRAGMRLSPWLSDVEKNLGIVQGMYYVPQGLNVWAQLECRFPGHYAREQERCDEATVGRELIAATTTNKGLTVRCELDTRSYPKGIKVSDAEMTALNIKGYIFHPEWNYTISPTAPT